MSMRIAFVTPAYYPAIIGASLYCQTLARGLTELGHEVDVFSNSPPQLKKEEVINDVKIRRFYPIVIGNYYISKGMLKALLKEKYDIIHSHHFGYYPATSGFMAAKLRKTKHVFGPYYHPPIYGFKRWLMFSAYHLTQGLPIIRFSEKVLPHTEEEKKLLLKVGGKIDNMEILPNTVDTKKFIRLNVKKENIILFVGNFIREKGADIAFDIAKELIEKRKDIRFVFIGNPVDHRLLIKIEKLKQTGKVLFLKNVSESELIKWYNKARVIICPSKHEAFGKVIAEAQACGTPAIVTKVGGLPEVVQDKKAGFLIDYGYWNLMKEKIEFYLDNPSTAEKMGLNGRAFVKKHFDEKLIVNKLGKIYNDLA